MIKNLVKARRPLNGFQRPHEPSVCAVIRAESSREAGGETCFCLQAYVHGHIIKLSTFIICTYLHLFFPFPYSNNVPLTGRMPELSGHVLMESFTSITRPIRHFLKQEKCQWYSWFKVIMLIYNGVHFEREISKIFVLK